MPNLEQHRGWSSIEAGAALGLEQSLLLQHTL